MKLLFVHPGPLLYTNVFLRLEPLGLELVAEAARRRRHSVRLIDLQGESPGAYHRMIAEWRPDFIAFSCNCLANVPEIVDLAVATKIVLPRAFICIGGHSASFIAETILEHGEGASTACSKVKARQALLSCSKLWQATLTRFQKCPAPSRQMATALHHGSWSTWTTSDPRATL